ncbi:hypothetical protein [Rhizobacter sp. Root404]|uniref:hypothetical protein n=1 Tax=Rhizobacter sp. Root404 TaxID=1736528 RepID=UPI000B162EBC
MNLCITRVAFLACAFFLGGCSTLVSYHPRVVTAEQTLKFAQGVGTLSEKAADHELFMYPTFKMQGTSQPTFTIGYANNSDQAQNFSVDNVKAFYRGMPVPLYTYTEKVEEIRQEKLGKQIALAILGGAAAVAAANSASRQTYTSNYSGVVGNRYGVTRFYGSNTIRVYDPTSGMIAGAAVGGATGIGIGQIEYNSQAQEAAADAILQANTVEPQRMVSGQLILKKCCDQYGSPNDAIRFEVTANGKLSVFEFLRTAGGAPAPLPTAASSSTSAPVTYVTAVTPVRGPETPLSASRPVPLTVSAPVPAAVGVVAPATTGPVALGLTGGKDLFQAERLPETRACASPPKLTLTAKGGGYETYSVPCANGDSLAIRCEFGNCRVLR